MKFTELAIPGSFLIEVQKVEDPRGFFGRVWCREEFASHGIRVDMVQGSISHNRVAGTVRGLHFAWPPSREEKLVRCGRGRLLDVLLDLRAGSPAYLKHVAVELDEASARSLYIPSGVAHGFQTLADETDVVYLMTEAYRPECGDGVRFDDPAFGIAWPLPAARIADRDRNYPDFDEATHRARLAKSAMEVQA